MAKKASSDGVNRSEAIREVLTQNPTIKASEAVATLKKKGIDVKPGLFYLVKGKMKGKKSRRKKARKMVKNVTATMGKNGPASHGEVVATILKVKHLAAEVGGLKKLAALVEALST